MGRGGWESVVGCVWRCFCRRVCLVMGILENEWLFVRSVFGFEKLVLCCCGRNLAQVLGVVDALLTLSRQCQREPQTLCLSLTPRQRKPDLDLALREVTLC